MGVLDYFKSGSNWTVEEVREFLKENAPGDYNLVDVRQPREYRAEHIPGARLIPLKELPDRLEELDRTKPTIAYWEVGGRSRAAASILSHAGFEQVCNMEGGIMAWRGVKAEGFPKVALNYFGSASSAEELVVLAWHLEEGTRKFYVQLLDLLADQDVMRLFEDLGRAEQMHKSMLERLYEEFTDKQFNFDLGHGPLETNQLMEGGVAIQDGLDWARNKTENEIVEFAMALEANAYDRYLTMLRMFEGESFKTVFMALSEAEKRHLEQLTSAFEALL